MPGGFRRNHHRGDVRARQQRLWCGGQFNLVLVLSGRRPGGIVIPAGHDLHRTGLAPLGAIHVHMRMRKPENAKANGHRS